MNIYRHSENKYYPLCQDGGPVCLFCSGVFGSMSDLVEHLTSEHVPEIANNVDCIAQMGLVLKDSDGKILVPHTAL